MGQLVATGGIHVPSEAVGPLERALDQICADAGFPSGEEFTWSPRRNQWMSDTLVAEASFQFFSKFLEAALSNQTQSVVVLVDRKYKTATNARTYEEDATNLLIERIHMNLASNGTDGIVVTDRPGGGRGQEDAFLASCLETLQAGTRFVMPERIALNVLSTPSHLIRLLQLADVVTSSTLSYIAGEVKYAPRVFGISKPLFCLEKSRIGVFGIMLHPG